jgi:hypothetical protein
MSSVILVEDSKNEKVGSAVVTYASLITCPNSCNLKNNGCYAQNSYVGMTVSKLDKFAKENKISTTTAARKEAYLIRKSFNGGRIPNNRDFRMHVSGDTTTKLGAKILSSAIDDFKNRGGGRVWSYTHAWAKVPRSAWTKNLSILASVETPSQVEKAREAGYAPAIVVEDFGGSRKAFKMLGTDTKFIPCPAQTNDDVTCVKCGLCMDSERLFENNLGIAFSVHGIKKDTLKKHLKVIG